MNEALAPLVPATCDCRDLDSFMLNVERLMASELVAIGTHEVIASALLLWCRAWKQMPAASLPDDDTVLAGFARLSVQRFRKIRDKVLHGFVKCSDGRLYHRVLAAEAIRAFERKTAFHGRRERDRKRLEEWREKQKRNADETRFTEATKRVRNCDETTLKQEGQGQGQLTPLSPPLDETRFNAADAHRSPPARPTEKISRGCRLSPTWEPSQQDRDFAASLDLPTDAIAASFRDYWTAKAGANATKLDWSGTWRNWCRKDAERRYGPASEPDRLKPTPSNPTGKPFSPMTGGL